MLEQPVTHEKVVVPGANRSIWLTQPLLRAPEGQLYRGRVFVEVWSEVAHLAVVPGRGGAPLEARALAALQSQSVSVPETEIPWTSEPTTGDIPGQSFLGRAVIEVWDAQSVVAVTGPDAQVRERAIRELEARQAG